MRQAIAAAIRSVGSREFRFTAVTARKGRDGHVLIPQGVDTANYKKNPVILWQHRPENPVGRCTGLSVTDDELRGSGEFPSAGASQLADEICALVKSGIVNAVSVGFDPIDTAPLDQKRPRNGQCITRSELLEISLVSVPADVGAVISMRGGMIDPNFAERRAEARRLALGSVALSRAERQLEALRLELPAGGAVDAAATRDREFLRSLVHCQQVGRAAATEGDFAVRQRELRRLARAF